MILITPIIQFVTPLCMTGMRENTATPKIVRHLIDNRIVVHHAKAICSLYQVDCSVCESNWNYECCCDCETALIHAA